MDVIAIIVSVVAVVLALIADGSLKDLRKRIQTLELDLAHLRREMGEEVPAAVPATAAPTTAPPVGQPVPPVPPLPVPSMRTAASAVTESAGMPDMVGMLAPEGMLPPIEPPRPVLQPLVAHAMSTEEWEVLIGGRWLNRVGALALMLGMAFFLKYAIDNNWISEPIRIGIGLLVGLSLLEGARRTFREALPIFAQGLLGAGLATLYLSVYAASNLYHLIPYPLALVAMAVVTALAFAQALSYDSLTVAVLAWIGGFATVPLLGMSGADEIGIIGYVALLDAAILTIVARRDDWFILEPLAMGTTYAIYADWYLSQYHAALRFTAMVALSLFWVLFYALDVWRILARVRTHGGLRHVLGAVNAIVYMGGVALLLASATAVGLFAVALGAVYLATILLGKRGLSADPLDARYALTAIVLAVIATLLLTTGFARPILWSLEALVLLGAGVRWKLWYAWWPAVWLYGIVPLTLIDTPGALLYRPVAQFIPIFNARALAFLVVAATLAAGSLLLRRLPDKNAGSFVTGFQYAACAMVFLLLSVETDDLFRRQMLGGDQLTRLYLSQLRALVMAAVWMVYAIPFVLSGLRSRVFPLLSSGLAAAALAAGFGAAAGFAYQPIEHFTPVLNDRVLIIALLIGGLVLLRALLARDREAYPWIGSALAGYQAVIILLGFELVSAEIHDYFRHASGVYGESSASGLFIELMTLSAVWLLYSFPLVRHGVRNRALSVLLIGLGALGAATGAGAVASLLVGGTDWLGLALSLRPLVVLGLMIGLYAQSRLVRRAEDAYRWLDTVLLAIQACTVLLGLELVSVQTRDIFHHQIAAAGGSVQLLQNLEQLSYSVVWLLYALGLLIVGFWRRVRWMRLAAIALLGFIILKIVGYDLSFLSPAYRSISFVGLGLILLASSYLYQRYRGRLLEGV